MSQRQAHQQRLPRPIRRACLTITSLSLFFACLSGALAYSSTEASSSPPQLLGHYTIRGSPFRSSVEAKEHIDPAFHPVLQQETLLCSVPLIQQQEEDVSSQRYGQGGGGGGQGFGLGNAVASGQYTPPDPSECPWTRAVLEFSAWAPRAEQQRERVGGVWIDGVEVLRTTTPVPTESGTFSSIRREVTRYSSLLRRQEGGDQQGGGGGASVVVALEDVVTGGGGGEASEEEAGSGEDFQVNVVLHFYGIAVPGAPKRFGGRGRQFGQQQGPSERGGEGRPHGQQQGPSGGGGEGRQYGQQQEEQGSFGGGPQYGQQQEEQGSFGGGGRGPQYGQQEGQGSFGGGGRGQEEEEEEQGSFGGGGRGPQFGQQQEEQGWFGPGQLPQYGQQQGQQRPLNNRRVLRKSDSGPEQSGTGSQEAFHLLYGKPADLIIPISNDVDQQQAGGEEGGGGFHRFRYRNPTESRGGGRGYWFRMENELDSPSRTIQIPPNTHRAVLEIFASSHLDDEFWYATPLSYRKGSSTGQKNQSNPFPFPPHGREGGNSLRQVFASVDGLFVGSEVPFPVVYSGGINPLFWSPVAALGAFNLPTYDLELTPFLGNLLDGSAHELRLGVTGAKSFWLVDANLHLWLDQGSNAVQGKLVRYRAPTVTVSLGSSSSQGFDGEAKSKMEAERKLLFSGWVSSSLGNLTTHVEQSLEVKTAVEYKHDGRTVALDAKTKCDTEVKVKDEGDVFIGKMQRKTKYPIKVEMSLQVEEASAYRSKGTVSHELNGQMTAEYRGAKYTDEMNNKQKAEGWMLVNGEDGAVLAGSARSDQTYARKNRDGCYRRSVTVQDGVIQHDGVSPSC